MTNREELSSEHKIPFSTGLRGFDPDYKVANPFVVRLLDWQGARAAIYGTDPIDGKIYEMAPSIDGNDVANAAERVVAHVVYRMKTIEQTPADKRDQKSREYLQKAKNIISLIDN